MRPAKRGSHSQDDPSPGPPPGFVTSRCEKRGPKGALRERSRFQVPGFRFRICDLVLARFVPARGIRCQPQELSCVRRNLGAHSGPVPNQSIDGQGHFLAHKLDPKDLEIFPKVGAVEIDLVDFSRQSLKIHAF